MADPEHLAKLKEGVGSWNQWRKDKPDIEPDLRDSHLRKSELIGVDFRKANLGGAQFDTSNFYRANLSEADLRSADLSQAYLKEADLSGANLKGADLRNGHLTRAHLNFADLTGANLGESKLFQANLGRACLVRADLSETELSGVNLVKSNLKEADFSGARLQAANLFEADLSGARLHGSDLHEANLQGALLCRADLRRTILRGAILRDTDFDEARMGDTVFGRNDLSAVKGLERVNHLGPSIIGIDTIYRSKGNIPESFLRGCGVPGTLIAYLHSAVTSADASAVHSCFISHSSKDGAFASMLHSKLTGEGVACWFAPEDLKIGDKFQEKIDESIGIYDMLLVVLSENSINSSWVEWEVRRAIKKEQEEESTVLFPIRLDDAVMETPYQWAADVRKRHIGDFRQWKNPDSFKKSLDLLLRDLQASGSKPKKRRDTNS